LSPVLKAKNTAICLKTYDTHFKIAKTATAASGTAAIIGGGIGIALAGPFGIIPLAIAGGAAVTSYYYKKQYEKAWFLLKEVTPNSQLVPKYVNRIAANSRMESKTVARIIWKNEPKFCKGKLPWTYRKIRKAIKKKKLTP